jgi:hypothetical protein
MDRKWIEWLTTYFLRAVTDHLMARNTFSSPKFAAAQN